METSIGTSDVTVEADDSTCSITPSLCASGCFEATDACGEDSCNVAVATGSSSTTVGVDSARGNGSSLVGTGGNDEVEGTCGGEDDHQ